MSEIIHITYIKNNIGGFVVMYMHIVKIRNVSQGSVLFGYKF